MRLVKRSKDVLSADFEGVKVLFYLPKYMPYMLNQTASFIWDYCRAKRSLESIAKVVCKNYGINKVTASRDTKKLVFDLKRKGLVEVYAAK